MAKAFGILLIVLGIWVGLEIFTEGTNGAFGGLFARFGGGSAAEAAAGEEGGPATERIRERVGSAYRSHEARTLDEVEER